MVKMQISEAERAAIHAAIIAAEGVSSAEIIPVIAAQSADHRSNTLLFSIGMALAAPLFLWFLLPRLSIPMVWAVQVALFCLLELLHPLFSLHRLVPAAIRHHAASRHAGEQFVKHGVHTTKDRAGLLLFVSLKERYVEIIPDIGISSRIPPETWQGILDRFTAEIAADRLIPGLIETIATCAAQLALHFPACEQHHTIRS